MEMLSKLAKWALDTLEKEPEKVKEVIDGAQKLYENRKLIVSQKEALIKGFEAVEAGAVNTASFLGNFLKGKK